AKGRKRERDGGERMGRCQHALPFHAIGFRAFALSRFRAKCRFAFSRIFALSQFHRAGAYPNRGAQEKEEWRCGRLNSNREAHGGEGGSSWLRRCWMRIVRTSARPATRWRRRR